EVVVTAQAFGKADCWAPASPIYLDWLRGKCGRIWRIKASLDRNRDQPKVSETSPDFVGWGSGGPEVLPGLLEALRAEDPLGRAGAHGRPGGWRGGGPAGRGLRAGEAGPGEAPTRRHTEGRSGCPGADAARGSGPGYALVGGPGTSAVRRRGGHGPPGLAPRLQ